ncbi:unnamed protein product [Linum trigynum]|uniref:Uncharacterized protein n=1 Tax=Linum trigynum TaxID=586398 RepID=A0AAV2FNX3_9ROSI
MDASPLALRRQTTLQLPASPFQPRRRIRAWKLKLRSTWRSAKTTFSRNLLKRFHHHRTSSSVAAAKKQSRIAPSNPNNPQTDAESKRIGRRDIVVAWRGTVAPSEKVKGESGRAPSWRGGGRWRRRRK